MPRVANGDMRDGVGIGYRKESSIQDISFQEKLGYIDTLRLSLFHIFP